MSVLRRIDDFLDEAMPKALRKRERRGAKVLKLDDAVAAVVAALKEPGMTSPYLKAFVVARVNPIRFSKSTEFDFDEVMDKMIGAAQRFKVEKIRQEDLARAAGGPPDEEESRTGLVAKIPQRPLAGSGRLTGSVVPSVIYEPKLADPM